MYKVDFPEPGTAVTWTLTDGGVERRTHEYYPTFHVAAPDHPLSKAAGVLDGHPKVAALRQTQERPGWRHEYTDVLEVDATSLAAVDELATTLAQMGRPGQFRLYEIDLSREFRYCLETGADPTPNRDPSVLRLGAPERVYTDAGALDEVTVGDETHTGTPDELAGRVEAAIDERDPDVLRLDTAELVPALFDASDDDENSYQLGREPGYTLLAGTSSFESYGNVGHSPARYNVPGRAIVDESNSFILGKSGLHGLLDLVSRSRRPLQETAWASIGRILTAIQIDYARDHDVLVPWRSWRPERFKRADQLDAADRGGYTFAPDVGVHEDVHEVDFSSLYPNIIRECNISPETVRCDCHPDREDVPGLGYSICPHDGYLPEVLGPLIDDRDDIKDQIAASEPDEDTTAHEARSEAIKWILVCCFGYQGHANAKFGRIECHEAINAFAREILVDAKDSLEAHGWRVVHGIVDSLWVQAIPDRDQTPIRDVVTDLTEDVGIRLDYEAEYDWIAFCPRRNDDAGALTRYFGHEAGAPVDDPESYKYRGIELRQRSTPPYVAEVQQALIQTLGRTGDPEVVCDRLQREITRLETGEVEPERLAIRNRVSKSREEYTQATKNVAALERAADRGLERHPGEDVRYVVVDDEKESRDRVSLVNEAPTDYDAAFYRDELVRAAESILSPLGWREADVRAQLATHTEASLGSFAGPVEGGGR